MASQATLDRSSRRPSEATSARRTMTRNLGHVAHDLMTLAELQIELFKTDLKDGMHRVVPATLMLVIAGVLALGAVPIAMISIAYTLALWLELSLAASFAITALAGFVLSGAVAYGGYLKVTKAFNTFERSQREWSRNFQWLKETLKRHPDHPGMD